jgi:hypothetical protein
MERPWVVGEGCALQIWREVADMLNKQSRTDDKGWGIIAPRRKINSLLRNLTQNLGLGLIFGTT